MTPPAGGADFSFTDLSILWPHGTVRLPVIDEGADLETWSRAESERTCDRRVNAAGRELRAELLRNYTMMARELESVYAASVFPLPTQSSTQRMRTASPSRTSVSSSHTMSRPSW